MSQAQTAGSLDTRDRILQATMECAAQTGLRKLSMDEIAQRAGIARATLYLHFPGREALIDTAVRLEIERLFRRLATLAAEHDDPAERLGATFALAYRWLRDHPVLDPVLRMNPQILLPYVFGEATVLQLGSVFIKEVILAPGENAAELAEHFVRQLAYLVLAPPAAIVLETSEDAESYARRFLVPLLG